MNEECFNVGEDINVNVPALTTFSNPSIENNEISNENSNRVRVHGSAGKIFIGGISWQTTAAVLKEHFGQYGSIVDVVIMLDKGSGRPRYVYNCL